MKRFFALLLTVCLLVPLFAVLPASAAVPVLPATLSLASPAIKADVGETADLSLYNVTADDGTVLAAADIAWTSDEIAISDGKVTPTAKGIYRLAATAGGKSKTVYLLVKEAADTEYVLFDEDFESVASFDDLLAAGYSVPQQSAAASIAVTDGKLVLSGQAHADCYIRMLFPAWLGDFGNYRIELNAAMTARKNDTHWMAFMYRVQNDDYPYFQNTFRAITTAVNGTEVAERNADDKWEVVHTQAYSKPINDGTNTPTYHDFVVEAFGDYVSSIIDGTAVATDVYMPEYDRGRVGLQVRAAEMTVESYRVVIPAEGDIIEVTDPNSDVVAAPSIITEIDDAAALTSLAAGALLPATAILQLNSDLNVTTSAGALICSLENALMLLENQVIPAFAIGDTATADALGQWLADSDLTDVFVIADNANLIQRVRNFATICRGVLDMRDRDLSNTAPADLRAEINRSGSRVVLLPASYATRDNVTVLHNLLLSVWVEEAADTNTARVSAIVSGVNGIVTADPAALAACYTDYFMPTTLTRAPGMIGHRGTPVYAQENTVESAVLAVELGATLVEADFYLTKDNIVVGMHDSTIDGTTNGAGRVKDFTYDELCQYAVNDNTSVATKPIPTLVEYCEALKGKDVRLLIEIKDGDTAICQYIVDIIDDHDMRDQVNVISFNTSILQKFKDLCPELSVGFLYSGMAGNYASIEAAPESAVAEILGYVQQYDSTYNPQYGKIGPNLIKAASHRGVLILPWTINSQSEFDRFFRYGSHAFTTDYMAWVSDYIKDLRTNKNTYITNTVGGDIPLSLNAIAYNGGVTNPARATLTVVESSGTLTCSYESGMLKTSGTGSATCLLSASFFTASGSMYSKCTELFTVTVDTTHQPPFTDYGGCWHLGNGAPDLNAEEGDLYLDLAGGNVYQYADQWEQKGSLKGADGEPGIPGTDGVTPQFRISDRTGMWEISYNKGATWHTTNVVAQGPQGPAGEDGLNGSNGKNGTDGTDGKDGQIPLAELNAAKTTATVAVVISCVLLAGNAVVLTVFLIKKKKKA